MLIRLRPGLAKLLISGRESERREETYSYLEKEISEGRADNISPIWISPNLILNGLLNGLKSWEWHPTIKPFIVYNGHHRLEKFVEHNLPVRAYLRFTLFNPEMPKEEILKEEIYY